MIISSSTVDIDRIACLEEVQRSERARGESKQTCGRRVASGDYVRQHPDREPTTFFFCSVEVASSTTAYDPSIHRSAVHVLSWSSDDHTPTRPLQADAVRKPSNARWSRETRAPSTRASPHSNSQSRVRPSPFASPLIMPLQSRSIAIST